MRQIVQTLRSQIQYTVILPYLTLMVLVMLVGSGAAITLVAGSWQERFNNQLGQVARNFAETLALREISNISYLGQIIFTAANAATGAPAVPAALAAGDRDGLDLALRGLWTLGQGNENIAPDRLIVFDAAGQALADWERAPVGSEPVRYVGTNLAGLPLVDDVLRGAAAPVAGTDVIGDKYSGLIAFRAADGSDALHFFTVVPVYVGTADDGQRLVGGLLVAQRLDRSLAFLQARSQAAVTALYDNSGVLLATTAPDSATPALAMTVDLVGEVAGLNTGSGCLDIGNLSGRQVTPLERIGLPACSLLTTASLGGYDYQLVYAPLLIRGAQAGYFTVGLSRDFVLSAWASSRNAVIAVTALLAVLSVLVGYQVARQITRPLNDLVATAEAVTAGDLGRRSAVRSANELGTLATAFNQMTAHLLQLYATSRDLNRSIAVDEVLATATASAASFVPGCEALAVVPSAAGPVYRLRADAPPQLAALAGQPAAPAALPPAPQLAALADPQLAAAGVAAALAAPLISDGQPIGALIFAHPQADAFSPADQQHLAAIANMALAVLANATLYEQVQRDAEQRRAILASIGDGVVVSDRQGRVVLLNPTAEQLLGLPAERAAPLRLADLPLSAIAQGREIFGHADQQIQVGERFLTMSRAPVQTADGATIGEVLVLHDVTAAVQVDRAKTDFIATISHELRTPLTVIRGFTELLLRGSGDDRLSADQADLLGQVRGSAVDMTNLVNNAIMVANLDAGQIQTELRPLAVETVVEAALTSLRPAFAARGLSVAVEIPADLPLIRGDREQIKSALGQLLDNARRFTSQGGVTVRAGESGDQVWIAVSDTGPGIPADMIGRLFSRFQRVDGNSSAQRGGGLGLSIARQLIELQGGSIQVASTLGQGSTFTVTLARAQEQTLAVATTTRPANQA